MTTIKNGGLDLVQVRDVAAALGAAHEDKERAASDVRDAGSTLLVAVADAVRPALKAMASPVLAAVHGRLSEKPEQRTRRWLNGGRRAMRGVLIGGGVALHGRGVPGVTSGSIGGRQLYLLDEWVCSAPEFLELRFEGTWSETDDAVEWVAQHETMTASQAVERRWDVGDLVEALVDQLEQQANARGNERRAEKLVREAERLRAVETLLRRSP